jgi:hypothetical protein
MEAESYSDLPVNETEIQSRMLEPEKHDTRDEEVNNRNLQIGNVKGKEIFWLHNLESARQNISKIPVSQGGDIFAKWGHKLTLEKNHFLALSGSRNGFVRQILRTSITKNTNSMENMRSGVSSFFNRKKGE